MQGEVMCLEELCCYLYP